MPPDARLTSALSERYALESELGQGGMATVYLARDVKHDRQVAVKVLRPELAAILGRERFLSEIRLTAKLDHPHILTLLDSGESDGYLWYTLPYIRGESLRHKLDRETQLGVDEAVSITRQIAGALDHAHRQGIIHRDVKPENILLHEGEAMLADFGIALAVKEAGGQRLTETGLSLGTPQYMSPEQATAEKTLDARSDIYSLGAVLYEMLAGEPPFTGATGQAVIAKLMVQEAMQLRIVRKAIPPGLEAAVSRALAKVPADRFPSAAAFAAALAAPEAHRAPRWVPKRALAVAGVALAVLAVAMMWLLPGKRSGGADTMVGEPALRQLTLTGNAVGPAISPDGKQLAYGQQTCRSDGDCDEALVVQDLGSGERKPVPERFEGQMGRMTWSPDQRFLLVNGTRAGQDGLHIASLFSGEVRYLGEHFGGQFLGGSDTIIAFDVRSQMNDRNPGLATRWFPVLTADGAMVDSVPFNVAGIAPWPLPSPDGRRILIWSYSSDDSRTGQSLYLIDRAGRLTDSLPTLNGFHAHRGLQWTASGDGVLVLVTDNYAESKDWTMLRFPVNAEGKVRLPPDTVARRLRLPMTPQARIQVSPPSRTGTIAVEVGERTYSIAKLERPSLAAPPTRKGQLLSATGRLGARISPDGERVRVWRQTSLNGQPATQLEIWPFDSGSGTALGPPRKELLAAAWSSDGSTTYRLARGSVPGMLEHSRIEVASGRTLQTRPVPDSLEWQPWLMLDSLLLYLSVGRGSDGTPREWRTWSQGGGSPLVFSFPDTTPFRNSEVVIPDGRGSWLGAMITSKGPGSGGPPRAFTLYIAKPGVPATRFPSFEGPWYDLTFIHAGPGPVFEILADGFDGSLRRLLLEPGRPPRDVGAWPLPRAPFPTYSDDGRRGVVGESELRTDIWLLEWPGGDRTGTN